MTSHTDNAALLSCPFCGCAEIFIEPDVLSSMELLPVANYHEDYSDCLFFHLNSFDESPEVYCGCPLEVQPEFDEEYWTHFVRFDFSKIIRAAIQSTAGGQDK